MASRTISRLLQYRPAIGCSTQNFHKNVPNYSEAVSTTKDSEKPENKRDPFGIEDIDDRKLVQGYFEQDWERVKKKVTSEAEAYQDSPKESLPNQKKYEDWLRYRKTVKVREKFGTDSEALRNTSFGEIRLDSDNVVEEPEPAAEKEYSSLKPNPVKEKPDNPTHMLASEYLKKFKKELSDEALIKQNTKKMDSNIIQEPTQPRLVKRKTKEELEEDVYKKVVGPEVIDAKKVPDVYLLPAFNKLTQMDMWSLLKHTEVFQNEYIFAINKPSGVPIHSPAIDCRHYITQFLSKFAELAKCEHIYPLHRLDKETSGVLLFAKDIRMAKYLTEKFAGRQIKKKYLAITKGCPDVHEGTIKIPIGEGHVGGSDKYRSVLKPDLRKYEINTKQKGCREAITHFRVINSKEDTAFLEIQMETGVKHQIRLHLGLGLGCPIIGDHKYSHRDKMAPQRLHPHLLHAIKVRQSKVRELPLHLHCNSIQFNLPEGATDSIEPVYVHANVPRFFNNTLRAFGLK